MSGSHRFQSLETKGITRRRKCADLPDPKRKEDIEGF
jgi:hypothetical protein